MNNEMSDQNPSFTAALKSRLAHVRRSGYHALVDDNASELASTPTNHRTGTRQAAQGVDARKAQAATARTRTGALRSAADIPPPHLPSQ